MPVPDPDVETERIRLDGAVPSPQDPPSGCRFHTRCPRKLGAICELEEPPLRVLDRRHQIRCHLEPARLAALQAG